jgi:hypothetical protein
MTDSRPRLSDDECALDALVAAFFALFSNAGDATPNLRAIFDLCIPQAVISKCVTSPPEVFTLESFIGPRQELLTSGALTGFEEVETAHRTSVFGNVAQRVSAYMKSGVLEGAAFQMRGVKVFQFIRTADGWRISAVSWDDEREGFTCDVSLGDTGAAD